MPLALIPVVVGVGLPLILGVLILIGSALGTDTGNLKKQVPDNAGYSSYYIVPDDDVEAP